MMLVTSPMVFCFLEIPTPTRSCPVPPPCTCYISSEITVSCGNHGLTHFPSFTTTTGNFSSYNIYLVKNNITSIPDDAFKPLVPQLKTSSWGTINLSNNLIQYISDRAFQGIGSTIRTLNLNNNRLASINVAFKRLDGLEILFLKGNPISSIDPSTFGIVGKSIGIFEIDLELFPAWPMELGLLENVRVVGLKKIHINIPDNAFTNWTYLQSLTFENSQLSEIPRALCEVNATVINFYNNLFQPDNSHFKPCTNSSVPSHPRLSTVIMQGNNLTSVSNVFTAFPKITILHVDKNPGLRLMLTQQVPYNHSLTSLRMTFNRFFRFPEAIHKLIHLQSLDLSHNHISSLQRHDLAGLVNLQVLTLNYNPLTHIASDTFIPTTNIAHIELEATHLTEMPQAVFAAQALKTLSTTWSPIECSCAMMSWSDHVVNGSSCSAHPCVYIFGNCKGGTRQISDFLHHQLSNCTSI